MCAINVFVTPHQGPLDTERATPNGTQTHHIVIIIDRRQADVDNRNMLYISLEENILLGCRIVH